MHIDRDGLTVLRGFLPAAMAVALRDAAERAYATTQETEWGGITYDQLVAAAGNRRLFRALRVAVERGAEAAAGPPVAIVRPLCCLRRHRVRDTYIPWHIDADGAGTYPHDPCWNVWLPLAAVGDGAPSLQFIPGSHRAMRQVPLLAGADRSRSADWVREQFPGVEPVTPRLYPGDAVIFDHYVLHRTEQTDWPAARVSAEIRVSPPKGWRRLAHRLRHQARNWRYRSPKNTA